MSYNVLGFFESAEREKLNAGFVDKLCLRTWSFLQYDEISADCKDSASTYDVNEWRHLRKIRNSPLCCYG